MGLPLRMSEMLAGMPGSAYVVRRSLHNAKEIIRGQEGDPARLSDAACGLGFSMVELLSTCPTNWGVTPIEALRWIEKQMLPYYPLGDYRCGQKLQG